MMQNFAKLLPAVAAFLVIGCTSAEERHRQELIGSWRSQTLSVQIASANNTNHDIPVVVGADDWVKELRHLPVNTIYRENGTFLSDYRRPDGSTLQTLEGDWTFKGDTLYIIYTKPNYDRRILHFSKEGEKATLHGLIDFDGDKSFDDDYTEEIIKTSDRTE